MLTAYCLLSTAYCQLLTAYYLLFTAYSIKIKMDDLLQLYWSKNYSVAEIVAVLEVKHNIVQWYIGHFQQPCCWVNPLAMWLRCPPTDQEVCCSKPGWTLGIFLPPNLLKWCQKCLTDSCGKQGVTFRRAG